MPGETEDLNMDEPSWRRPLGICVTVLLLAAGCATPHVITYDTNARQPLSELALIRLWRFPSSESTTVHLVDELNRGRRGSIEYYDSSGSYVPLTPGQKTLWVILVVREVPSEKRGERVGPYQLQFVVEKGHLYDLTAEKVGDQWHPVVTDTTSGRRVYP